MNLYTATITLLLVMDPLGNIPAFLACLNSVTPRRRQKVILRESFIAFAILIFFLFFGQMILDGMQISQPALSISGGILLFLIAIRMIFPHEQEGTEKSKAEPFIVPLAVPFLAGPSTMTVVMLLANQEPNKMGLWFIALSIAWFITAAILVFADVFTKILGERGLIAAERLMGMILTTMAVQMFLTGFIAVIHS